MDFIKELGPEISLSKGLSKTYDLYKLILSDNKAIRPKSSISLKREFDEEKWFDLKNFLSKNPNANLEKLEEIEDGSNQIHIFFKNKNYLAKPLILRNYIKNNLINYIREFKSETKISSIIELGSGYGSKLLSVHKTIKDFRNIEHVAMDISKNGLSITKHFANLYGLDLKTINFDYRKSSFKDIKLRKNSILFTIYGLHYKENLRKEDIYDLISSGVKAGIHFEPCSKVIEKCEDKLYSSLSLKYMIYNNYTLGISSAFEEVEKEGLIKLKIFDCLCGNGLLPGNWLEWKAT